MKGLLEDKVALVTGAAAGIGRTIVRHLADAGALGLGFDVAAHCPDLPRDWLALQGDVCSELDEWDRVFAVNVRGVAATIKHAVPLMKPTGGSIIVMGSLNSRRAHPAQCLYTASKHAVLGIVRAVALDLGRFDIRVNALGPGPIATEALVDRIKTRAEGGGPAAKEALQQYAAETALGRIASEDDVARTALFLASTQSYHGADSAR
jgi:NAD(P)-dependent dehydrogenase (short-subunit alcohol dehydrogenase family)